MPLFMPMFKGSIGIFTTKGWCGAMCLLGHGGVFLLSFSHICNYFLQMRTNDRIRAGYAQNACATE